MIAAGIGAAAFGPGREAARRLVARLRLDARTGVWWLPSEEKLEGKPGLVVLSEGLAKDLSQRELAAVVDHERPQLRGRHHRLVGFAHAAALLPVSTAAALIVAGAWTAAPALLHA
ncbi:hypothetical protein F9C11_23785 [Amycolatopsis sp. VS8301801F10]|uniref:hypothetical protein n=1 Tax=Amycolatopsis sp. VS8301801F10 TaxID=2652442 RepID=UPI0038FCB130